MQTHLCISGPQRPLQLNSRYWVYSMCKPDFLCSGLRKTQVLHFALLYKFLQQQAVMYMQLLQTC